MEVLILIVLLSCGRSEVNMKQKKSKLCKSNAVDELQMAELLRAAKPGGYKLLRLARRVDLKKLSAALGVAAVAASAVSVTGRYKFYRSITASELKKQLSSVNQKLDELQAQNLAMQAELEKLNKREQDAEKQA